MRSLYGEEFNLRYIAVARAIQGCSSVLDVCCGPARLKRHLERGVRYRGLDCNQRFVSDGARRGVEVLHADVRSIEIPKADGVVMISGLYQFIPHHEALLKRMIDACQKCVVVSEPIVHTSRSHWLLSKIANVLLHPGVPYSTERFDEQSLSTCFRDLGFERTERVGHNELMGCYLRTP